MMRQHSLTPLGTDRVLCSTTTPNEDGTGELRRFFAWEVEDEQALDLTAAFRPEVSDALVAKLEAELAEDEYADEEEGDELGAHVERSFAVSADGTRGVIHIVLRAGEEHVEHQLRSVDLSSGRIIATSDAPVAPGVRAPAPVNDIADLGLRSGVEEHDYAPARLNGRRDYGVLMGVSADGTLAYFFAEKRLVAVETTDLSTVAHDLRLAATPSWGTVCADAFVAVTFDPDAIVVVDLASGKTRHSFPLKRYHAARVHAARTRPIVAVETTHRHSTLIDVESGKMWQLKPFPKLDKEAHAELALSPDGQTLVAVDPGRPDGAVVVDVETSETRSVKVPIPTDPAGWPLFTTVADRLLLPEGLTLRSTPLGAR